MKFQWLRDELEPIGFKVLNVVLMEDGYVIRISCLNSDSYLALNDAIRGNIDKIDQIDYKGFILVEQNISNKYCSLLLVPKTMDEMTDFIWRYVEKHGKRDSLLNDVLSDAFSALGKAIERIPMDNDEAKKEAQDNYNKFTSMIF